MFTLGSPEQSAKEEPRRPNLLSLRLQNLVVAALLLVFLVVGWRGREPVQVATGDSLIYLSLSRSLESGSYREIFRASAPLHVKYPPGYPAWLVLARHATGERLDLILAINLALVAVSFVLIFAIARHFSGQWLALSLLLLMVLNPGLLGVGGSLNSEALFLLLSTSALAATLMTGRPDSRWALAATMLASLAFLTRSAGIAVVVAVGVWLWSRRKGAELLVYSLVSTIVVGGWVAYVALASRTQVSFSYATEFANRGIATHASLISQLAHRVGSNAIDYGTATLPSELMVPTIPGTLIDNWIWLIVEIVLLTTGLVMFWRQWRAAAAYVVSYAGLLLLWPWPINRLLDPIVPLVLLALLAGGWRIAARWRPRARILALGSLVALLTFGAVQGAIERVRQYANCDRVQPYQSAGCYDAETLSEVAAAKYLRLHAAPDDVVLANRPAGVNFLSGHPSEPAILLATVPSGSAAQALRAWKIPYIMLTARAPGEKGLMATSLLSSCRELWLESRFPPHALLLSTVPPTLPQDDACTALVQYMRELPIEP